MSKHIEAKLRMGARVGPQRFISRRGAFAIKRSYVNFQRLFLDVYSHKAICKNNGYK